MTEAIRTCPSSDPSKIANWYIADDTVSSKLAQDIRAYGRRERERAIEEAAKECEEWFPLNSQGAEIAWKLAALIREMKARK